MLRIIRTQPSESAITTFLDAAVSLRDGNKNIPECPDLLFSMRTYEKIAKDEIHKGGSDKDKSEGTGDQILLPINLFFAELTFEEQREIYEMYRFCKDTIEHTEMENKREIQDTLQERIFNTISRLRLAERMITLCRTDRFIYPDLSQVGIEPHHTNEKTFLLEDYIEITAISILSKMMVPIWGEFIRRLGIISISNNQREKMAFDLIEPTLEEGAFERIYNKLSYSLSESVAYLRKETDNKTMGGTTTSYILTHNGIDDQMFNSIIMATIIVKRLATYECFTRLKDGNIPNAMVYIDNGIERTADTRIKSMRNTMDAMPRRELPGHDQEDNISVLDHASKTSKKPIDVPIFVTTAVQTWELPKLLEITETPIDVFESASTFYSTNSFDVSPLCQAMVASFIGTRFGGSKCIGYLPPHLYQKIVVLLQVFLIKNKLFDLAALVSSRTSTVPIESVTTSLQGRITSNMKSAEYLRCVEIFKGYLEKPVIPFGKRAVFKKGEIDKIDFMSHISRMIEWLVRYSHSENMAPALWEYAQVENRPIIGDDCRFDELIVRDLCRFYLLFHDNKRPF